MLHRPKWTTGQRLGWGHEVEKRGGRRPGRGGGGGRISAMRGGVRVLELWRPSTEATGQPSPPYRPSQHKDNGPHLIPTGPAAPFTRAQVFFIVPLFLFRGAHVLPTRAHPSSPSLVSASAVPAGQLLLPCYGCSTTAGQSMAAADPPAQYTRLPESYVGVRSRQSAARRDVVTGAPAVELQLLLMLLLSPWESSVPEHHDFRYLRTLPTG